MQSGPAGGGRRRGCPAGPHLAQHVFGGKLSTISAKEFADAIDLSEVVELYVVREFAECATEENTEALKWSLSKIEVVARECKPNAAFNGFRGILAKGAGNVFVEQALTRLRGVVLLGILRVTMSPWRLLKQVRELQLVPEAIVVHDPGAAKEAMRTSETALFCSAALVTNCHTARKSG